MTLKIAIVGCGKIADGHIEEIQKMPERARVVSVCDQEMLMAEQIAVRYGVPARYDVFDRMLEVERPDVVHITTPPQSHLLLARKAIEAGCHVYVEKPLAMSLPDVQALVDLATTGDRKMTVGWEYLFDPPALEMRRLIAEGVLGEPVHVESCFGYNLSGPFGSALLGDGSHWVHRLPGKLFHNNIDHLLNKVLEFMDDESPDISIVARAWARREKRFGDARDDMLDELRVMLQGSRVSASGLFSSHARPAGHFLRVYGTRNTLHVDFWMRTVALDVSPKLPSAIGRVVPAFDQALAYFREGGKNVVRFAQNDFHFFSGLNHLIGLFYDSITAGAPLPISYRDMIRVGAMMDEIFRQVPQQKERA
jgi:predicted dehydrogenase